MFQNRDTPGIEGDAPRSQTSLAYEVIRSDILNGRHLPEKKLKIQELAADIQKLLKEKA